MPENLEEALSNCSKQIKIPIELPDILKAWAKAAIKTQPMDLLNWSVIYFRSLVIAEEKAEDTSHGENLTDSETKIDEVKLSCLFSI